MPLRDYQAAAYDSVLSWHRYRDTPAIVVIPTGGGKTHVISAIAKYYTGLGKRTLLIAHRKELLTQAGKVMSGIPFAYYSASIGEKRLDAPVTVANIQSIFRAETPQFDCIIIDECHRVPNSEDGQYHQLLKKHPNAKVVGLTATPYRLKGGALQFGEIVYSVGYKELLDAGHLSPVTNKVKATPDLTNVSITAGDFTQDELEYVMADGKLILEAVKQIKAFSSVRKSILIFCVSVKHCNLLGAIMGNNGMQAVAVSGDTPMDERDRIIEDFKSGKIKYLINCEVFLEGFDSSNIDMIVGLRPTKSKALWEQLVGRGVRKAEGKQDCLLLDMAGNLMEHGGLGTPHREKGREEKSQENGKICPTCETFVEPLTKECPDCGYKWPDADLRKASHDTKPDHFSKAIYEGAIETYQVNGVRYAEHVNRKKGTISLRVDYLCNTKYGKISEWLVPHHESEWVRDKAYKFFKERGWDAYGGINKYRMEDLLWHAENLKKPVEIVVDHSQEFARIKKYVWAEEEGDHAPLAMDDLLDDDLIPF